MKKHTCRKVGRCALFLLYGRGIGETAEEQSLYGAPVPTSRDPTPSPEDVRITRQICEASKLLDIELLDHLVIGRQRWVSLKERGLGFD